MQLADKSGFYKQFFNRFDMSGGLSIFFHLLIDRIQGQKFVAVFKAKNRGAATSQNAKNRGIVAVKIVKIAALSRRKSRKSRLCRGKKSKKSPRLQLFDKQIVLISRAFSS